MLNLILTTDSIEIIRSSTANIDVQVSGADTDDTTLTAQVMTQFKENATFSTAATSTISAAPASNHRKNVKFISVRNTHASTSNDITIQFNANSSLYTLIKCTLLAGESLIFSDGTWLHYDVYAGVYGPSLPVASDTVVGGIQVATQAEQETSTAIDRAVTPGRQHFHPSAAKFWVYFTGNSTTVLASYNTTSITDGTSESTITIANDFSSANWCPMVTGTGTASTVAAARLSTARAVAAGTMIAFWIDGQATPALAEPSQGCVMGFGDQ